MTWFVNSQGYELFFNRDERITRQRAVLPSVELQDGVSYISPTDADAGGTWIAANQFGISICLLNHYQFEQIATYQDWISRGDIVRQFASLSSLEEILTTLYKIDLQQYRAFRLFIINPQGQNRLCVWNGHELNIEHDITKPKSSSSVDAQHVKALRKGYFADLGLADSKQTQDYQRYHASHYPNKSSESVCMHRDDANTVSFSHIVVDQKNVAFAYADGAPCKAILQAPLHIPLYI